MIREGVRPVREGVFEPSHRLLVAAFICLGVFLRAHNFAKPDLWIDEYSTWWVISGGDWADVARRNFRFQGSSPLYGFIVKLSSDLLGVGTASFRLPSIFFGIGIVGLAYPIGVRIFHDRHTATLALAAFAVNERLIYFSQDARPYSLALLCAMLSFLFYLSLLTKERLSSRIGYLLATAGAYYAHYLLGFVMVIHVLHLFFARGWSSLRSRVWTITFSILALVCLPGAIQILSFFRHRASWEDLEPTGVFGPAKLALDFLDPWAFFPTACVVVATSIVGKQKERLRYHGLDLTLVWFLTPIVFFSVVPPLFGISLLRTRYVLASIPAAIFLVAWCMAIGQRTFWQRWLPLAVFLTLTSLWTLLPALSDSGTFSRRPNQGWNRAAAFIDGNARSDDLIIYRVGSVEANRLALPNPDPLLVSYVSWPLAANLRTTLRYRLVGLPYSANPQTTAYVTSVLNTAPESRRIWIVGSGSVLTRFAEALLRSKQFQVREHILYRGVVLMLLEQSGASCDGRCK